LSGKNFAPLGIAGWPQSDKTLIDMKATKSEANVEQ